MLRRPAFVLALALTAAAALPPATAAASASFTVQNTTLPANTGSTLLQTFYNRQDPALAGQLQSTLQTQVNTNLANLSALVNQNLAQLQVGDFLRANAHALNLASKGLAVDYASDLKLFSLSGALGVGVHADPSASANSYQIRAQNGHLPGLGAALNINLTLGINLGFFELPDLGAFELKRLKVYASLYSGSQNSLLSNSQFSFTAWGLHGQYQLVEAIALAPAGLFRWGGVNVASGLTYGSQSVTFTDTQVSSGSQTTPVTFQGKTLNVVSAWTGKAQLTLDGSSYAIPIEASTSLQLGYVFTLFVGAGFDLNFGSTELRSTSKVPVGVSVNNGAGTTADLLSSDVLLTLKDSASPRWGDARGFAGLQLNFGVLALFGQVAADSNRTFAGQLGARAFW